MKIPVTIAIFVIIAIATFCLRRYETFQTTKQAKTRHTSASTTSISPLQSHKDEVDAGITKHNATSHVIYSHEYKYESIGGLPDSSFSQDGNLFGTGQFAPVLSENDPTTLRIWDVHSHSLFRAMKIPRLRNFAFSPDHKYISVITGTKERYGYSYPYTVKTYDLRSGRPKHVLVKAGTIPAAFYHIIYSRNGRYIAADAGNSKIYVWNATTGKRIALFSIHGFATSIAFSPDGNTLAAASGQEGWQAEARLSTWSIHSQKLLRSIKLNQNLNGVTFSPNGKLIVAGGYLLTGLIYTFPYIMDAHTLKIKHPLQKIIDSSEGFRVAFSPDGNYLAFANDTFVYVYKLRDMTHAVARFPIPYQIDSVGTDPILLAIHFTSSRQLTWAVSSYEQTYKITLWQGTF